MSDFDMTTIGAVQTKNWEASKEGGSSSYGLNLAANPSSYKNATYIVQILVDSVKERQLLNLLSTAEGEIIAPTQRSLLRTGERLKYAGKCVFATNYWFTRHLHVVSTGSTSARFIATPNIFCVTAISS
ncbi:uncharacterized protein BT62DRAFT_917575 [Guyanagaster necrorhizus]|uniref:Uncharacterized protein n=1 Tax=Guyanagaster necrorhizus TaxID=856835 RepID=A0A9P7VZJ8_9AGAR|nr:uncharacterized protein BT62DRAFT_917575 [Guyanagaster necrorhizus MCA 3950]KAG7450043.1 hypothetical protein BT62DRAFT_917575 [Guyanagaster necrorhizus MCA 3950]